MQTIIQNTIMHSTATVLFYCLVAFKACNANKFLPHGSVHYGHLTKRQDNECQTPASCNPCVLPPLAEMPPALAFLNELGRIVDISKGGFAQVFETTFESLEELRTAIHENLENVKQNTDALITKISQELGNTESCPPLENLFPCLRTDFNSFLSNLITKFDESVTDADPNTVLATLAVAMAPDIPYYLELIRDLLIYCVDVYLTDDCEAIEPIISTTLDPSGNIAYTLMITLSSPGIEAVYLLINIIGSLLPGVEGGALDYINIFFQLLCASVQVLQPGTDFSERTGGYCPKLPETFVYKDSIKNILCRIAELADVTILATETVAFCQGP